MESGQLVAIEQLRGAWMIRVVGARAAPALPNLVSRLLKDLLVGSVLPLHQLLDDLEEPLPFLLLGLLGLEQVGMGGGVIDHLGKDHGPRSREGSPSPPEMQRRGVTVPDGLLPR